MRQDAWVIYKDGRLYNVIVCEKIPTSYQDEFYKVEPVTILDRETVDLVINTLTALAPLQTVDHRKAMEAALKAVRGSK